MTVLKLWVEEEETLNRIEEKLVSNWVEAFIFTLSSHAVTNGIKQWRYKMEWPWVEIIDEDENNSHSITINCLSHDFEMSKKNLSEMELVTFLVVFHGNHEGCHLKVRINDRKWIQACNDH